MKSDQLLHLLIIILAGGIIGMGIYIRVQNISIAELTQSVAQLSDQVLTIVKDKRTEWADMGDKFAHVTNPASKNCVANGGELEMRKGPLGTYGACIFESGECEEWTLYRDDCPVGGIDVSGLVLESDIYCAITGHEITPTLDGTPGFCQVNNTSCLSSEWYETGECKWSIR